MSDRDTALGVDENKTVVKGRAAKARTIYLHLIAHGWEATLELSRYELAFLRDRLLTQFEDIAGRVLPDINLVKNKVARLGGVKIEKQDPLSDPFLTTV